MLILARSPRVPYFLVITGIIMLVITLAAVKEKTAYLCLPFVFGITFLLSNYCWLSRIWIYAPEYWPDEYVQMANMWKSWMTGAESFSQLKEFLSTFRNGQSWLISFLIAVLQLCGINYLSGYMLLNICFTVGSVMLIMKAAQRFPVFQQPEKSVLLLAGVSFHLAVIRISVAPLTDAGGMFFTTLFFTSYLKLLMDEKKSFGRIIVPSIAFFFGVQARIALLPVLAVPPFVMLWQIIVKKELRFKYLFYLISPALAGIALLSVSLTYLNLWNTILLARKVSASPVFTQYFSIPKYFYVAIGALQTAVIAFFLSLKRLTKNKVDFSFLILFASFGGMLMAGRIIPWFRYWAPIATLATFWGHIILGEKIRSRVWYIALIVAIILLNLYYVLKNPTFC